MKWLVIGGAGFLGSHLVKSLVGQSEDVVVSDIVPSDSATRLSQLGSNITYRWQSVHDLLAEDLGGVDRIVFCAAQADVPLALSSPRYTFQQNIMSVLHLLELLRHSNRVARLVYLSTEDVYGTVSVDRQPVDEEEPLKPVNPYGVSKATADMLCASYAKTYGVPVVIIRSSAIFGPESRTTQVIPVFTKRALYNQDLTIEGDGSQTRDFNYVSNAIDAVLRAADKGRAGEAYNVGSGEETSIAHLAKSIIELTGSTSKIVSRPRREGDRGLRFVMSIAKAKNELGYGPRVRFLEGLKTTVESESRKAGQLQ